MRGTPQAEACATKTQGERMDAFELRKRYHQFFCRVDSLDLSLDISRMHFDEKFLASMEPAMQKAFKEMDDLESGMIANPDEKRMAGRYWLRAPQLAPTKVIALEITGTVKSGEGIYPPFEHVAANGRAKMTPAADPGSATFARG
jgi:hypothetical protein